ncbi:MAG: bifunctional nuclease family protein [Candidatus Omnitrophota bacterium]|nr:MAG: bifunctional nuclease family protein [Candidatus Omnitrophota bacterium]
MIEVELSRIIVDEEKREQVIVLKECSGSRLLPIVIGMSEAAAIKMHLSGFTPPRPLTHDLMCTFLGTLDTNLERVVIDKLVDSTFHAKLYIKTNNNGTKTIDARPSDSIALAVRTKAPIFVEEEVFDKLAQEK